jgi:hypothetical protein
LNQVAAIHLTAFATASTPAYLANPSAYEFVELPSHVFLYNQGQRKQHDYMYFFEAWENKQLPADPVVFTAIINLSSRAMTFAKDWAGRSVNGAPMTSATGALIPYQRTGRGARRFAGDPEVITILPGCMHMYKREVCHKDNSARSFTYQTRLSKLYDHIDLDEFPDEETHQDVCTDGVMYMQMSIAVYPHEFYGGEMKKTLQALQEQKNMRHIGGLQQSSLYQGKQASSSGKDGFVAADEVTKRYPLPLLFNQLTNAYREETKQRFIGNHMMQREEISRYFYQDVLFIYNGSAPKVSERIKLVIPRNGRAYDAQRYALDIQTQAMSFTELESSGRLKAAFRKTDNNSTFTTRDELDACEQNNASRNTYVRIYPCIMPPLRNLHGLPGLFSERDHFTTSTAIGMKPQFQPFKIMWI